MVRNNFKILKDLVQYFHSDHFGKLYIKGLRTEIFVVLIFANFLTFDGFREKLKIRFLQ